MRGACGPDCGAGRGLRKSARRASGKPRAACANSSRSIQSLRPAAFVNRRVMATADLDTLTCAPAVKRGLRSILRSVRTASPIAHKQKRRMPISRPGINKV